MTSRHSGGSLTSHRRQPTPPFSLRYICKRALGRHVLCRWQTLGKHCESDVKAESWMERMGGSDLEMLTPGTRRGGRKALVHGAGHRVTAAHSHTGRSRPRAGPHRREERRCHRFSLPPPPPPHAPREAISWGSVKVQPKDRRGPEPRSGDATILQDCV